MTNVPKIAYKVSKRNLREGDLVFFHNGSKKTDCQSCRYLFER